jgi:molecular chaperone DnaJ
MPKDYYIILGVSKNAELSKIKRAYRQAVKRFHPDLNPSVEDTEKFLEIKEAYDTLGNEDKRRNYDETLARHDSAYRVTRVPSIIRQRTSRFDELNSFSSPVDDFLSGFLPGFFDRERRVQKDLYLDLVLSPREAADGGLYPITVPVIEPCPDCSQSGFWEDFFCPQCRGYGRIRTQREFNLSVPPHVTHGSEITLSLEDIGLQGSALIITVVIDASVGDEGW